MARNRVGNFSQRDQEDARQPQKFRVARLLGGYKPDLEPKTVGVSRETRIMLPIRPTAIATQGLVWRGD